MHLLHSHYITQNTKDILPALLRMLPPSELQKYESTTPVLADWVSDYNSCVDFNDKVVATKTVAGTTDTSNFLFANTLNQFSSATSYHANPLGAAMDSHLNGLRGRGSYVIDSITEVVNGSPETSRTYTVVATFTEPLLMSPWIFRGLTQTNSQGIYGLMNFNIQLTLDPTASRCWRYADGGAFTKNVSLTAVNSARLLMCFMTPHPSLMLPSKNIVPYYTMDIYRNTIATHYR